MATSPLSVAVLTDEVLEDLYDPGSLARGEAYADEDRVQLLGTSPGIIKAVCQGSGRSPYVVQVRWNGRADGFDLDDTCSCPIGGACKHCVAAILTARWEHEVMHGSPFTNGGDDGSRWRTALAGLAVGEVDGELPKSGLALQIVVDHPRPSRWSVDTGPRLMARPMRRGKTGKWIKTGASWRDMSTGSMQSDIDQRHRSALRALAVSGGFDSYYAHNDLGSLTRYGPDLWPLLDRVIEAGVTLVGEHPADTVEVAAVPAKVHVDLTADAAGSVTLATTFGVGDEHIDPDKLEGYFLGTPAHGFWRTDRGFLELVPLAESLHPGVAQLVAAGPITVPAADVDELLDRYQPVLARHAEVGSSDDSVVFTTSELAGLVLVVERTAPTVVDLAWYARYRRGDRTVDHPLRSPGGLARDLTAEAEAIDALALDEHLPEHLQFALLAADGLPWDRHLTGPLAVTVLTEVIPSLEADDLVVVEHAGDQPRLREASEDPLISLRVSDSGDPANRNDWFDLAVSVSVEGETIDFVTLFTALNEGDDALILPSGTWLRLDRPDFDRLRALIAEARGLLDPPGPGEDGVARINRFQTSWWDELSGLGVVAAQSERWANSVGRLGALTAPEPVPVPAGLDATLRHYQQEGLDWLAFLHGNGLGGILADDMGLGKTVQTLALCLHVLERDPDARFLVVAPTSVVENWAREAARFAPGLDVRTISATAARRGTALTDEIAGAQLVVTSYALFRLEYDDYAQHDWELLLLDEAQFVKNHTGKTYQCVRRLDAATKIAVTGTPLENSLMDLWALLSITAPGLYPDPKRFSDTYRKPIEKGDAPELLATLRRRIAPLMRRRTKDEVLTELPPKTEQVAEIELSPRHRKIYDLQLQRQRQKVLGLVGDVRKNRFEIFKSLTLLRQLALDPGLVDEADDHIGSAKLDRLLDDVGQVVAEGHRALVFSQFTRYLKRVRTRLDEAGIDHSYLDGRTRKRDAAISRFKDGDAPVFVISLKAGGFGLNLTEADYCFILDPWWNPATENQAVDRTHRIGQANPVMVYRYVSTGTIEEKVMELKARKADLFASVMDADGALNGALSEDDIRGLLDLG